MNDGIDAPAKRILAAKLRLDEGACLLIRTVRCPERDGVLLAISPDEAETHPGPRSVETPLFHDTKIVRMHLTILPRTQRLQFLEPSFFCGRSRKAQWRQLSFELSPRIDVAHQDDSLVCHEKLARRLPSEPRKHDFREDSAPRR